MQEEREEFVEPEVIKHQEKVADVTLLVGYDADQDPTPN
jgi:hypothetical protein